MGRPIGRAACGLPRIFFAVKERLSPGRWPARNRLAPAPWLLPHNQRLLQPMKLHMTPGRASTTPSALYFLSPNEAPR